MKTSTRMLTKPLQEIPGVGPSIAEDLWNLGIKKVSDLKGRDPERLYRRLCRQEGKHIDRCVLYIFRCAVYYASTRRPHPDKLLWWNWKDTQRTKQQKKISSPRGNSIL